MSKRSNRFLSFPNTGGAKLSVITRPVTIPKAFGTRREVNIDLLACYHIIDLGSQTRSMINI